MPRKVEQIGLDLGAATMRVCTQSGQVHEEPAWIQRDLATGRLLCVGQDALLKGSGNHLLDKPFWRIPQTPDDVLQAIMRHLIDVVEKPTALLRPRVYLALRDSVSTLEQKMLAKAVMAAGAREVEMVSSSALAYSLLEKDIFNVTYFLMLDIGASKSDVVLRNSDTIFRTATIPVGGWDFDRLIAQGLAQEKEVWISGESAERLKETKLAGHDSASQLLMINGRHITDGTACRVSIESEKLWMWLEPAIDHLAEQLVRFLMLGSDTEKISLAESGLMLYGGGAMIEGLADYLSAGIGLKVCLFDKPKTYAIAGLQKMFDKN